MPDTEITATHKLWDCQVGPDNCGDTIVLFRAPVLRDGSGSYKRLPHEVQWKHLQEGDLVIAMDFHSGPSEQRVLAILQFWQVVEKVDDETFRVLVNNVAGMSGDGDFVYRRMAEMVGAKVE